MLYSVEINGRDSFYIREIAFIFIEIFIFTFHLIKESIPLSFRSLSLKMILFFQFCKEKYFNSVSFISQLIYNIVNFLFDIFPLINNRMFRIAVFASL